MSELQQKSPQLHNDILYTIAEKLLESMPDERRIDFRQQNCYTRFMFLNKMANWTIISQFAKFKRIDFFQQWKGWQGVLNKIREEKISFYKNDSYKDTQSEEFGGPYIVPKGMLEFIIKNGTFRVNTITTFNFLPDDHSTDIKKLGTMNSLKAFCTLFLGKQIHIPDGLNNNIMIKEFRVLEPAMRIKNNLEAILAIDADELFIGDNIIVDCSQYKSSVIANKTSKIEVNEHNKFAANFGSFCSFIVRVCPNLKHLHIDISSQLNYMSNEFTDNFYSTIKAMETSIKSIKIGNEHLQITIELAANFYPQIYDGLPFHSHDLFKLGTPFLVKTKRRYIARSLEFADALGRMHKLQFKITD